MGSQRPYNILPFIPLSLLLYSTVLVRDILFHRAFQCNANKPYIKVVTHSQGFEWWRILMVECVAVFWLHNPTLEFSTLKMVHYELIYNS